MSNERSYWDTFTSFYPTLIIKNHLLTTHPQAKLLNNNHYQAVVYFLFLKADFTLQQINSFEKSRVMVGKFNQCWS